MPIYSGDRGFDPLYNYYKNNREIEPTVGDFISFLDEEYIVLKINRIYSQFYLNISNKQKKLNIIVKDATFLMNKAAYKNKQKFDNF
jgi:hypothetical protein